MIKTFEVENVKCGGCANTLIKELSKHFENVSVDLNSMPRKVTLELNEENDLDNLRRILLKLGYPMVGEDLDTFESGIAKAKSFVSCAIGKFSN